MSLNVSNESGTSVTDTYNWGVIILVPIVLYGITGNVLVCLAVSMEKRLQTVTNYFLFSLAVTDLHVCIIVMPISIMNDFFGYWRFDQILCCIYTTSDVLMCTSSILHLCSISLERYLAIRNPLKSRNKSKSIVLLKISLIWITASAISSPVTVLGILDQSNIYSGKQCMLRNKGFIIYGSILAFFIPLIIMVVSYGLTIRLLQKQAKLYDPNCNLAKSDQPILRRVKSNRQTSKADASPMQTRRSFSSSRDYNEYDLCHKSTGNVNISEYGNQLSVSSILPQSVSCDVIYSPSVPRANSGSNRCFLSVPSHHHTNGTSSESLISDHDTISDDERNLSAPVSSPENGRRGSLRHEMTKQIMVKASSILNLTRAKTRDKTSVRTEQKASKVLGFVFAIFVLCWAPFFIVNVLRVLCNSCSFNSALLSTFMWLGWISSTINPIIYTMFNCTFKQTFMKLIKCQYGFLQRPRRRRMSSLQRDQVLYDMDIPL